MALHDLYQEIIVDHGKSPRHFGILANATHTQIGHNPLCGDRLVIYAIERQGVLHDLLFEGKGCAISIASASLMIESVRGKNLAELEKLFENFHFLVTEGKQPQIEMGKLAAFSGVVQFPARVKCATLAWHTLRAALLNEPNSVSTEDK